MVSSMKERYEQLKKYPNISLNYDEILLFYPDYYKMKTKLEKEEFISQDIVDEEFNKNYKNSAYYKELVKYKMPEEDIEMYMTFNKDIKYDKIKTIYEEYIKYSIKLCELIDYIGHHPKSKSELKEEVNEEMEEFIKKYNIIISCPVDDSDEVKIIADDVVRIISTLTGNLSVAKVIKESATTGDWLYTKQNEEDKDMDKTMEYIYSFPESKYQKEEEKELKLQNK